MPEAGAWMPMYWADYLGDTMHLSTIEHGAYLLLIANYWRRGKPLPDDDRYLANATRLSTKKWKMVRQIVQPFFQIREGHWHHKRVDCELLKSSGRLKSARAAGKAGGIAKSYLTTVTSTESPPTPSQDSSNLVSEHPPQGGDVKLNGHAKHETKQGTRLTEGWRPSSEAVEHCKSDLECSTSLLKQEFPNFQCYFLAATGASARKVDWDRTFINWMRRARRDEVRYEQLRSRRAH